MPRHGAVSPPARAVQIVVEEGLLLKHLAGDLAGGVHGARLLQQVQQHRANLRVQQLLPFQTYDAQK